MKVKREYIVFRRLESGVDLNEAMIEFKEI